MYPDEYYANPRWWRTGDAFFPLIARVHGHWWVLRVNSFPDHPLYTLFIGDDRRYDVDDVPPTWQLWSTASERSEQAEAAPGAEEIEAVLALVRDFVAYGSEVGQPCDNPYCCG